MYGRRQPSASSLSAIRERVVRPRKPAIAERCAAGSGATDELDGQQVDDLAERSPAGSAGSRLPQRDPGQRGRATSRRPGPCARSSGPSVAEDEAHEVAMSG